MHDRCAKADSVTAGDPGLSVLVMVLQAEPEQKSSIRGGRSKGFCGRPKQMSVSKTQDLFE
jgi:hypothetical protein